VISHSRGVDIRPRNGAAYSRKRYYIPPPPRHSREGIIFAAWCY